MSDFAISVWGTPSNTSKKVVSSSVFMSSLKLLLNKIFDAFLAFSKSSTECTMDVISFAKRFCKIRKCGTSWCSVTKASMSFLVKNVNILMYLTASSSLEFNQYW